MTMKPPLLSPVQSRGTRGRSHEFVQATRAQGFSLVELMIALTIGLVIIVAVGRIFVVSRTSYQTDTGLARVQENARFAMNYLQREIRMAGYLGCMRSGGTIYNNLNGATTYAYNLGVGIMGHEFTGTGLGQTYAISAATGLTPSTNLTDWTPQLEASANANNTFNNRVLPGNDVIVVRRIGDEVIPIIPNAAGNYMSGGSVFTADTPAITALVNEVLIVADCEKGSVFQLTSANSGGGADSDKRTLVHGAAGTPGNDCVTWGLGGSCPAGSQSYGAGSQIARAMTTVFYIGRSASNNNPALFRAVLRGGVLQHEELVEGVENMQILYGVDTNVPMDMVANRYVPASAIATTAWNTVVSVRIGLLLRTPDTSDATNDTATYLLTAGDSAAGTTVDPVDDRRRRRVFTTTIHLRNRLPG